METRLKCKFCWEGIGQVSIGKSTASEAHPEMGRGQLAPHAATILVVGNP